MPSGGPFLGPRGGQMRVECSCGWVFSVPDRSTFAFPTKMMDIWERHWRVAHAKV